MGCTAGEAEKGTAPCDVDRELRQIRENLPSTIYMMVGGPFASLKVIGVESFTSFETFMCFAEKIYPEQA